MTPVIDCILLVTTGIDLYRGSTASKAHALAAVYIGVSLISGKDIIKWADERFRCYVTKQGSKPARRYGLDYARHQLKGWGKHVLAFLIGSGILYGMITFIGDPSRTTALSGVLKLWAVILVIDLIITLTYFIWPRKEKI